MTSAWSHGWACDVVYLLRTRTAPRHEVCTYVTQCLPAFCVSPCRTARTALHCSAVQGCNRSGQSGQQIYWESKPGRQPHESVLSITDRFNHRSLLWFQHQIRSAQPLEGIGESTIKVCTVEMHAIFAYYYNCTDHVTFGIRFDVTTVRT